MTAPWRTAAVLALVGLALGTAAWVDRDRPAPAAATLGSAAVPPVPMVGTAPALVTAWFCPGVPAPADGRRGRFTILNTTDEPLATRTVLVPTEGDPVTLPADVAPRSRSTVEVPDGVAAAYVGAVVEVFGQGALVEQTAPSSRGDAVSPCASSASDRWFSAEGATTADATLELLLLNPFPEEAIVDITFATDEGPRTPQRFQGFVVPGRSLQVVDVDDAVRRNAQVAANVTARSGRLVAGRFQTYNAAPRRGLVAGLLAPAAAPDWWFANGRRGEQVNERIVVSNPGTTDVDVDVVVFPVDGSAVEPVVVTVAAGGASVVDLGANDLVPEGRHSVVVSAAGDAPIVVERVLELTGNRQATTAMFGLPVTAERWWVATTGAAAGALPILTVTNPTGQDATVTVRVPGDEGWVALPDLAGVPVGPAGSLRIELAGRPGEGGPLLVEGSGPLVVERFLVPAPDTPGAWAAVAVPER